jgi:hypothetical protein
MHDQPAETDRRGRTPTDTRGTPTQEAAEGQLDRMVHRLAIELLGQLGIGPSWPARSSPPGPITGRVRSEAAYAKLGGAAPSRLVMIAPAPASDALPSMHEPLSSMSLLAAAVFAQVIVIRA